MGQLNGNGWAGAAALALMGLGIGTLATQGGCDAEPAPVPVRPEVTEVRRAAHTPAAVAVACVPPPTQTPDPTPVTTPVIHAAPTARRTHTVQRGETLTAIARAEYGSGSQWHRLAAANPTSADGQIRVGQQIVVP